MRIAHQLRQLHIRLHQPRQIFLWVFSTWIFGSDLAQEREVSRSGRRTSLSGRRETRETDCGSSRPEGQPEPKGDMSVEQVAIYMSVMNPD